MVATNELTQVEIWLTFQEVCEVLDISSMTLRRLIARRAIQYNRKTPKGAYRFKPEWVHDYIARNTTPNLVAQV